MAQSNPTQSLLDAARDARYLLGRGYAREQVLKLCGDRYGLEAASRHVLRRGVYGPEEAAARKSRLLDWPDLKGCGLGLDGHNLLITLESALSGRTLLLADDGCVRDVAELGRNHRPGETTQEAAAILTGALLSAEVSRVDIYLDAPLPKSGELAAGLTKRLHQAGLAGRARAVAVPERELIPHAGPVASSDSALLDAVAKPVDLAGLIIQKRWPPQRLLRLSS